MDYNPSDYSSYGQPTMEHTPPDHSSYSQSDHWPLLEYPSQYISTESNQSSREAVALYSQYGSGYANTCPLPQSESPHLQVTHAPQMRAKSMSWPRSIRFPSSHQASTWIHQGHLATPPPYPEYSYQLVVQPFAAQELSGKLEHQRPKSTYNELEASMSTSLHDFPMVQSPDLSNDTHSVLESTSYQSSPAPAPAIVGSLLAQSGLGLNCHFPGDDLLPSARAIQLPRRARVAITKSHIMKPARIKRVRQSNSRVRPSFQCDYCQASFDRRSNLTDHMRRHTTSKQLVPCTFEGCNKAYGRRADVNRHVRSFHEKGSVSCNLCHKEFVRSDSLTRHTADNCQRQRQLEKSLGGNANDGHLKSKI